MKQHTTILYEVDIGGVLNNNPRVTCVDDVVFWSYEKLDEAFFLKMTLRAKGVK